MRSVVPLIYVDSDLPTGMTLADWRHARIAPHPRARRSFRLLARADRPKALLRDPCGSDPFAEAGNIDPAQRAERSSRTA
jgi:hypothetical protein